MVRLFVLVLLVLLSSCSLQTIAVKTAAPIVAEATYAVEQESNFESFKQGVPGNLTLIEGLLYLRPNDRVLLATLVKGYTAYAFIVNDTLYLEDLLSENGKLFNKEQSLGNYTKALKYAERYLKTNGISFADLLTRLNEQDGVYKLLDDKLDTDREDLETVLFMGLALSSLINIQRDNMKLIAQMPIAKGLFDWVCSKDRDINFNMCDLFYGSYEVSRPRMLGGNPEKGKKYFIDVIEKVPNNWLARTLYIQYYLMPMMDEDGYRDQQFYLETAQQQHKEDLLWDPMKSSKDSPFSPARLRIYQTVAVKRYEIIKKYEKSIF